MLFITQKSDHFEFEKIVAFGTEKYHFNDLNPINYFILNVIKNKNKYIHAPNRSMSSP